MSTEFDSLVSLSDWSSKLAELLAASRSAAEQSDEQRLVIARRLTEFIAHSHPATPEIHRLDEIASAAARSLAEHVSSDAAERIGSRTALLEILTGELDAIRLRTDATALPSSSSIAELAAKLSTIAQDAGALARLRAGNPQSTGEIRARIGLLAATLADLHAAIVSRWPVPAEPGVDASGTVFPEGMRGRP